MWSAADSNQATIDKFSGCCVSPLPLGSEEGFRWAWLYIRSSASREFEVSVYVRRSAHMVLEMMLDLVGCEAKGSSEEMGVFQS